MLVRFQNNSETDAGNIEGVMPTKFCTGNVCCNNHKAQNQIFEKTDCKEFVIIGEILNRYFITAKGFDIIRQAGKIC